MRVAGIKSDSSREDSEESSDAIFNSQDEGDADAQSQGHDAQETGPLSPTLAADDVPISGTSRAHSQEAMTEPAKKIRSKPSGDVLDKTATTPKTALGGDVRKKRKKEVASPSRDNSEDFDVDAEPYSKQGTMDEERGPLRALENVVAPEQGNKASTRHLVKKASAAADAQTAKSQQKGKKGSKVEGGGLTSATRDALAQLQAKRARVEVGKGGVSHAGSVTP